ELEDTEVAIEALVRFAPGSGCRGEIILTTTACAHGLVHFAALIETRCSAIHMFAARSAEEGGVIQRIGIGFQHHQVEIASIGGGLESTGRGGQADGGAGRGRAAVVGIPAPTTEIDLPAI